MNDGCSHSHGPEAVNGTVAESVVEFDGVSFSYDRASGLALQDISLSVGRGQRLGVLGPNGGGKTTLIRLIQGEIRPHSGTVRVLGMSPQEARRSGRVAVVHQKSTADLQFPLSVRQAVAMAAVYRGSGRGRVSQDVRDRVDHAIDLVGLLGLEDRAVGALSGGQFQRVLIGRAVATGAELLLLDEPTVGIDVAGQKQFGSVLSTLQDELGVTIVIVSHQLRTVASTCDCIACLRRTLHLHGDPSGLTPAVIAEVFEHDVEDILAGRSLPVSEGGEA